MVQWRSRRRNTIDGVSIGDQVDNMANVSRKWRLSFKSSAKATLMTKLIMQKQHLQRRSCTLIKSMKQVVLISLMHFQISDLLHSWQTLPLRRCMVLNQNRNLRQYLKPVSRIGLFSLMSQNQNLPSVSNAVVAIVHNPKHQRSNELQTPDVIRKTGLPKLRMHRNMHTGFHVFVVFLCLSVHLLDAAW